MASFSRGRACLSEAEGDLQGMIFVEIALRA
jgi:hypothetical protein